MQKKVVGLKQSKKVIKDGAAKKVFVASDVQEKVIQPLLQLCEESNAEIDRSYTMQKLGEMCKIDVGASVVVLLKDDKQ